MPPFLIPNLPRWCVMAVEERRAEDSDTDGGDEPPDAQHAPHPHFPCLRRRHVRQVRRRNEGTARKFIVGPFRLALSTVRSERNEDDPSSRPPPPLPPPPPPVAEVRLWEEEEEINDDNDFDALLLTQLKGDGVGSTFTFRLSIKY